MSIYELYRRSPRSFIFIRHKDGSLTEYHGGRIADPEIYDIEAKSYPMYKSVLEIKLLSEWR